MFIDYLAVMLVNLAAGLFVLAYYIYDGYERAATQVAPGVTPVRPAGWRPAGRSWAAAFGVVGLVGFTTGLHMVQTWPLPGSYNIIFGEADLLFSALFIAAAFVVALGWSLVPLSVYAFLAGIVAVLDGIRIITLKLTTNPPVSGAGFIIAGVAALLLLPVLVSNNRAARLLLALVLIVAALIWAFVGYEAAWLHAQSFSQWVPATLKK